MLQMSKVIRSRDEWKRKAVKRANEIREFRKQGKRLKDQIAELKAQIKSMEPATLPEKKTSVIVETKTQPVRMLCIMLVLQAVVSYRSVPRILNLFQTRTELTLGWIPHFTDQINWTLRLGLGMLKQVQAIDTPWLAIIDHSIDIGTKKALVVLRVKIETLKHQDQAIQLKDCECIGMAICETVNGKTISMELETIFAKAGLPKAIIKDCDSTLAKGVRLWSEKQKTTIAVIDDIGHVMASALKAQFEQTSTYQRFTSLLNLGANRLRQTELVFLLPPKLRAKGRFLRHRKLGEWGEKMLNVFAKKGGAKKGSQLSKLRRAMPEFSLLKPFVKRFANTTSVVSHAMEILKNKGLSQTSYEQCRKLSKQLPRNSKVKKRLNHWLEQHLKIQKQITSLPLLVSSDIIESLFGNFKHIIERGPQADMNRTTLLLPYRSGNRDEKTIRTALNQASHRDLERWESEHIPYTVRKKRKAFFGEFF